MWLQAREGASGYAYVEVFVLCKEWSDAEDHRGAVAGPDSER